MRGRSAGQYLLFLWPLTYLDGKMAKKKKKKSLLSISDIGNGSSPDHKNRPVRAIPVV